MSEQQKDSEQELNPAQDSEVVEQAAPEVTAMPVGKILSDARKKLKIELADLAEQIRVPLNVLEAIELDKVPKNLPETFIRGYIRSYAKKVGVDESLVLTEVETLAASTEAPKKMQSFSRRNRRKATEKRLLLFSWFMVAVVLVSLVVWWFQDSEKSDFAPVASTSQVEVSQTEQALQISTPAENDESEQATTNSTGVENTNSESTTAQAANNETTANADASAVPVSLTPEQKALVADNGEADEDGFIKVEMRFENECWVEVYDVAGERVAVGNKPSGYLMTLNAQGPLSVLLGNPVGVSIWVNGKSYDTSDLPKNRVARFELEAF
ncbi:MAG: DUF4115 domain-containing protein [Gammaproteobacteria bacterium]|nr:DUF4115 domain-containing protein [Gammaproteobacteria bacterium]